MIYIYEGVNGTGKTNLCIHKRSENPLFIHYQNNIIPESADKFDAMFYWELSILEKMNYILLDRSVVLTEYVYSRVYNKPILCSNNHIRLWEHKVKEVSKEKGVKLFYLSGSSSCRDSSIPLDLLRIEYAKLFTSLKIFYRELK